MNAATTTRANHTHSNCECYKINTHAKLTKRQQKMKCAANVKTLYAPIGKSRAEQKKKTNENLSAPYMSAKFIPVHKIYRHPCARLHYFFLLHTVYFNFFFLYILWFFVRLVRWKDDDNDNESNVTNQMHDTKFRCAQKKKVIYSFLMNSM